MTNAFLVVVTILVTWSTFCKQENNLLLKNFVSTSLKSILKLGNLYIFSHMSQKQRLQRPPKNLIWDQAQFSSRFVNNIPAGKANEKRAWYKPSTKRLPPTFLIDWHLPNQPTKITSVACFSSMQIFHAWEKCRLADLKKSFYLLIFSAKNKTVSTITFNFLRD